jgi:hypothetical protein
VASSTRKRIANTRQQKYLSMKFWKFYLHLITCLKQRSQLWKYKRNTYSRVPVIILQSSVYTKHRSLKCIGIIIYKPIRSSDLEQLILISFIQELIFICKEMLSIIQFSMHVGHICLFESLFEKKHTLKLKFIQHHYNIPKLEE